jgi:hypothetical protein
MIDIAAQRVTAKLSGTGAVCLLLVALVVGSTAGLAKAEQNTVQFPDDPYIQVTDPTPNALLATDGDFVIHVTSLDRNAGPDEVPGVDRVELYLDAERGYPGARLLGQAQLGPAGGGDQSRANQWELSVRPVEFDGGSHLLIVYARSTITGIETTTHVPFQVPSPATQ